MKKIILIIFIFAVAIVCNAQKRDTLKSNGDTSSVISIKALQQYLNNHGFQVTDSGPGSPGKENNYFGLKTKKALKKFQKARGLVPDGVFGTMTKTKINSELKK
jgi:peptidoglycan hydrolase-like protein with peptidoglycan-binding domain